MIYIGKSTTLTGIYTKCSPTIVLKLGGGAYNGCQVRNEIA